MKIGTFQFASSHDIVNNYHAIIRGIDKADEEKVDILVMQECALCGYFEQMIDDENVYNLPLQDKYQNEIQQKINCTNITLIFGRIQKFENQLYNVVAILNKDENCSYYAKRALWGWDKNNFSIGKDKGFFQKANLKFATRICYEAEFPEYFREIFIGKVPVAFVSYAHSEIEDDPDKYEMMKGILRTRAFENSIYIVSSNDISGHQLTPTVIINPSGRIVKIASKNKEELLVFDYEEYPMKFGRKGIIENAERLLKDMTI